MARSYKDAFPSKYLKAEDIPDSQDVKIKRVGFEDVGYGKDQESKLVAHFVELDKKFVLNLTNADSIAGICRTIDYEAWAGHTITLFSTMTEYKGKPMACIRVREPERQSRRSVETRTERVPAWVKEEPVGSEQAGRARDVDEVMPS